MTGFPDITPYPGLIFDLDGTLIDSMPTHIACWQQVARERGFEVPAQYICDRGGISGADLVRSFIAEGWYHGDVSSFVERKIGLYEREISHIRTFPEIEALLRQGHSRGQKIAVGTGSRRSNAQTVLKSLGLLDLVSAIIAAEDVTEHKPHPQTFLKAAAGLALEPGQCLVFEDGKPGIAAAARGGFDCVTVAEGRMLDFIRAED